MTLSTDLTHYPPKGRTRLQIICAKKDAEIAEDQIRTISKKRLKQKIDCLSKADAAQLRKIITDMYGELYCPEY